MMVARRVSYALLSIFFSFFMVFSVGAQGEFLPNATSNFIFVLFYRSTCSHCQHFSPVLSEYAKAHRIEVLSVNVDSPEFSDWRSIFLSDHQSVVPKLFLVKKLKKTIFEVSVGDLPRTELSSRMNLLIEKIDSYERNRL